MHRLMLWMMRHRLKPSAEGVADAAKLDQAQRMLADINRRMALLDATIANIRREQEGSDADNTQSK